MTQDLQEHAADLAGPGEEALTQSVQRRTFWRGLIWGEWFAHSRIVLLFLGAWLVAVWTLPLYTHASWILVLGGLYSILAGPLYGGGDVLEGCEEYAFALPGTRTERYLAKLLVGAGTLFALSAMNLAALGLDLPQILAGLYVRSGLVPPSPVFKPGLLYSIVLAAPMALFSFSFAIAAATHSRMVVLLSWFWGTLGVLILVRAGFLFENLVWRNLNGYFSFPLLAAGGVLALLAGHARYKQKEVSPSSAPFNLPGYWWLWGLLFVTGLGLALALFSSLLRHFPDLLQPSR